MGASRTHSSRFEEQQPSSQAFLRQQQSRLSTHVGRASLCPWQGNEAPSTDLGSLLARTLDLIFVKYRINACFLWQITMSQEGSNQSPYEGQYMYTSVTFNKAKLEGLPDNFCKSEVPIKSISSLGRAHLGQCLVSICYAPTQQGKCTLDRWCGGEKGQSSTVRLLSLTSSKEGGQLGVPGKISPGGVKLPKRE